MLTTEVIIESPLWASHPDAGEIVRKALEQAQKQGGSASTSPAELAIVLTDDSTIRSLNRDWRHTDKPTDVLSFPAAQTPAGDGAARHLGDIVIAYETTASEAASEGKPFLHHLAHLAVHGYLHLAGYGHDADNEAKAMESLERGILATLGIADPYAARDAAP